MRAPRLTSLVRGLPALQPFVGPEAQERARGKSFSARLGANESAFGPSPKAIAAMQEATHDVWKYSDPESFVLRTAIAAFHGVDASNIVIGEGIDGLLGLTVRIAAGPDTPVVTSDGAYPTFNFHVLGQGARLIKVPFHDDHENLEGLLAAAVKTDARIIYVSNPNNPMGTWWSADVLDEFIARLPDGVLLILDEAYCDTAPAGTIPRIDVSNWQVLRYRTFSKAYGLAGARIGYAIGAARLIEVFDKVRNHYGINRIGQAGALAALEDQGYLAQAVQKIAAARDTISDIARKNGLAPVSSAANFVAIDCGRDAEFAERVLEHLLERGVFARKPAARPLDRCIRVSCGGPEDLDVFASVLPAALEMSEN
jgi:histidinol-phosphate aminotransferase